MYGTRIKQLRLEHSLTQRELAKYLGVSPKSVSFYELEQREPPREVLLKLSKKFKVSVDYILNNKVKPVGGIRIPVLGRIVAGIPMEAITEILDYEEISAKMAGTGEFFSLRIKGDSMAPLMRDGGTVIVRKQPTVENREVAIVLVGNDEATMKEVQFSKKGLTLVGWNVDIYPPHFYTNEEVRKLPVQILGRVVEYRYRFR